MNREQFGPEQSRVREGQGKSGRGCRRSCDSSGTKRDSTVQGEGQGYTVGKGNGAVWRPCVVGKMGTYGIQKDRHGIYGISSDLGLL